ncbi:iron-containing alcohol dehydrogenase [Afifella pfennigii]|uniref:iron-containing alcohol dehydrogenase n=1 Tax=Afifella pfennigii TaxID=209897 RepID=UPI00068CA9FD|nr:iron-containing alcohol dehydrogenase [Afifella pfennigii]
MELIHTYAEIAVEAGPGRLAGLAVDVDRLAGKGATVLLLADAGLKAPGIVLQAEKALLEGGHRVVAYDRIAGEPKEGEVAEAASMGVGEGASLVVALGGGSALDAGKMAAAMLTNPGEVADHRLAAAPFARPAAPLVAVPTTAGTGSEFTSIAVLSGPDGTKYWYWAGELKASLALLDPELTLVLPPTFTAMTGIDALVHAVEAATCRRASEKSVAPSLAAIRLVAANLPTAVAEPGNIAARTAMMEAAGLAGIAIEMVGTALAHNIGHALGSLAPIPHGLAVGIAMAATADWVVEGNPQAFALVAEAMGAERDAAAFAPAYRDLFARVGLPARPRTLDAVSVEALAERMAAPENAAMRKSTKRFTTDEDLSVLAAMVLAGKGRDAA